MSCLKSGGLRFVVPEPLSIILERNLWNVFRMKESEPAEVNMLPVGLRITRMLMGRAQKLTWHRSATSLALALLRVEVGCAAEGCNCSGPREPAFDVTDA